MNKKEKTLEYVKELHKKYPNVITEQEYILEYVKELHKKYPNVITEQEYIDDDKEHYIATFEQNEIKGSLTFIDKNTYESFLCLIDCLGNSGLEKPTEFAKFNDMMQLIAKKFPDMQATPHNLQKIAFATSLMMSAIKTM